MEICDGPTNLLSFYEVGTLPLLRVVALKIQRHAQLTCIQFHESFDAPQVTCIFYSACLSGAWSCTMKFLEVSCASDTLNSLF